MSVAGVLRKCWNAFEEMLGCWSFEGFIKSICFELLFEVIHFSQLFNLSLWVKGTGSLRCCSMLMDDSREICQV